jgi:hypothetical protein
LRRTISIVRHVACAAIVTVVLIGCTQQLVWPKEPLRVVLDDAPDGGGVPNKLVSPVFVEDAHRIDSGCTRTFPFRSFAGGPLSEKQGQFNFASREGFVYHLELIAADAGPTPRVQFYDGDFPIPVPTAGTWFHNGLSVKTAGPGSVYLRVSTCRF